MLDPELVDQLRAHFAVLETEVGLALSPSSHPKQAELRELLADVASASPRVVLTEGGDPAESVAFGIVRGGAPTGIRFRAVPGGHEFSSLVLALLHADGKGRWPDQGLLDRVRALRGPIRLRTYLSLSCTNCPDVVQALNQMALVHPDFRHEAVDGELAPDEIARLGVQGVPAVFSGDKLLHVGKAGFGELLEILEAEFGAERPAAPAGPASRYDLVVLGAGPAGVSAAVYSARKGLKTAIVAQRFGGQVNDTLAIENQISLVRTEGAVLAANLREHAASYPIAILDNRRVESVSDGPEKTIRLAGGEELRADQLIVATGARWRELGVKGEKEHIGRGVAFCPHCDGPFFKGRPVAVVGGGNSGVEAAIDLAGICASVDLFEFMPELKADKVLVEKLRSLPNVAVHANARVAEVLGDGSAVSGLAWEDRASKALQTCAVDGVFVQIGLVPNSAPVRDLVQTNPAGEIVVDAHGRSSVPGVYAAGDVTTVPYKQIVIAMGEGAKAALAAFEDRLRRGA